MALVGSGASSGDLTIHGFADAGYGPVVDAFAANFRDRGDVGAACCVYVDGQPAVDIWAGLADRRTGRAWQRDTSAVIFSCTKGVLAVCALVLAQDGRLDLDAPIAAYWPAFGSAGKGGIRVRDALTHRAGLAALDRDLSRDEVLRWDPVIAAIEAQRPLSATQDGYFYHAMTYGWIIGEVIRRVTGMSVGAFLAERLAGPLGLQLWIGIPDAARADVAWMEPPLPDPDTPQAREAAAVAASNPLIERSLTMGSAYAFPADADGVTFNDPVIQAAEIPGANGIATARSLARLYAACASGVDGREPLLTAATLADAMAVRSAGPQLSGMPDDGGRFGTGFQLSTLPIPSMLGAGSFGHGGAGGQLGFGDRDFGVGFGWLGNQMGGYGDARAAAVTEALQSVLRG